MKVLLVFAFLATVYALPYSKFQAIHTAGPNSNIKLPKHIQDSQFDQVKNAVSPVSFLTEVSDSDESNGGEDEGSEQEITLEDLIKFIQNIINEKLSNGNSADEFNFSSDGVQETNPSAIALEKDNVESHENGGFTEEYENKNESDANIGSINAKGPINSEETETPKDSMYIESEATEAYEGSGFSQDIISEPKEGNKVPTGSKYTGEPKILGEMTTSAGIIAQQGLTASDGITASGGETAPQEFIASDGITASGGIITADGITLSEGIAKSEGITTSAVINVSQGIKGSEGVTSINGNTILKGITISEGITGSEEHEISAGTEASESTKELDGTEISVENKAFQEITAPEGQKTSAAAYNSQNSNTADINLLSSKIKYPYIPNTPPKFYYKAAQGHLQHNLLIHPFTNHH